MNKKERYQMFTNEKPIFLIDCDGVMLDYNEAFKVFYEKIYGVKLKLVNPKAYHATEMWGVGEMKREQYSHFKTESNKLGMWENMPALPGALEFVQKLSKDFRIWCLTSMPTEFEEQRHNNLRNLGFPIEKVIATSRVGKENPKKKHVEEVGAAYFMDDLLQNFEGIETKKTKLVFLNWNSDNSPNQNYSHVKVDMIIKSYDEFKII